MLTSTAGPVNFGEKANLRIPGVLQRFGVCYLICATLVLFSLNVNFSKPEAVSLHTFSTFKISMIIDHDTIPKITISE
jgi:hypothetical protein